MVPIAPFRTMELLSTLEERRAAGRPIYRFDLGEPQFPICDRVREGVSRAILGQKQSYTESRGRLDLRQAISNWYETEYGVRVDHSRIVITTGASATLTLAVLSAFDRDANIAIPRPAYPAYRNIVRALERHPVEISCGQTEHFHLTPSSLELADCRLDGLIFASPANPTGAVLSPEQTDALLTYCAARDTRVISDEIYQGIAFDQKPITAAADERVFVVNSFSKFWRLTGWRIGWLVCPPDLTARVDALSQHMYLCPPAPSQVAALLALNEPDDCRAALPTYVANRDSILAMLNRVGITTIAPAAGAFYVFADFRRYTDDSAAFAKRLLEETGVALAPGEDFDPREGKTWIRFATTADPKVTAEGLGRLEDALLAMRRTADY